LLYKEKMLEQKIADILKKDIESLGCFIWGIEISGGSFSKHIVIYIDKKDDLITLEDCENVNIQAREVLDNFSELNFNFSLEISSSSLFTFSTKLAYFLSELDFIEPNNLLTILIML